MWYETHIRIMPGDDSAEDITIDPRGRRWAKGIVDLTVVGHIYRADELATVIVTVTGQTIQVLTPYKTLARILAEQVV